MTLSKLTLFQAIGRRLEWLTERQAVLARNIANADTPGFRPSDLAPFAAHLRGAPGTPLALATTAPGHVPGRAAGVRRTAEPDAYEASPNGNQVDLEQQMLKLGETQMDHQLAADLYRKHLGLIRTALGRSR